MHRFYLPPNESKSDLLLLGEREAHHASHVLRIRRGEKVMVLNGTGGELLCEVLDCQRKRVELKVIDRKSIAPLRFNITLLQALPKGKIIESIIQKATELGVARIVPLLTERVTTKLDDEGADHKGGKWQQVAIEAIKQCGAAWLPRVEAPVTPAEFLARKENFDLPLIASLQPGSRHPREYFEAFRAKNGRAPRSVCIWIGPEGDFTATEVSAVEAGGAGPITLGKLVLRVETAAIYCLSILNYELLVPSCD
ncbi:MAG TPA: RsmE family RNA methyltransferase [Candidatus Paceibacterota bacterium]|nr:RsmE family RNA methyltransferase [Candidatus Paceibacterota bacterium]